MGMTVYNHSFYTHIHSLSAAICLYVECVKSVKGTKPVFALRNGKEVQMQYTSEEAVRKLGSQTKAKPVKSNAICRESPEMQVSSPILTSRQPHRVTSG